MCVAHWGLNDTLCIMFFDYQQQNCKQEHKANNLIWSSDFKWKHVDISQEERPRNK